MDTYNRIATWKHIAFWLCCAAFGITFIFSGFVKAIDPLGTVYKIEDYLVAMHLDFLKPLSTLAAYALFSFEFLTGALILSNIKFKIGITLGALFMIFMTPLTLWIAVADPVSDCGCFGDALVISNWATFWKNIVLSVIIISLWWLRGCRQEWFSSLPSWLITIGLFLVPCTVACCSQHSLPMKDFRPYHIGADIEESMEMPADAEPDQYQTTFVYEKNGEQKEFSLSDAPYNDSTWTFVSQNTVLIKKGYTPPIHDFSIITMDGEDITYEMLGDPGRTYLAVMYDLSKTNISLTDQVESLYQQALKEGARFYALTASVELIDDFCSKTGATYPFAMTDPIQLKTMIRANPGIVVIEDGIIIDKWNVEQQKRHLKKLNEKR